MFSEEMLNLLTEGAANFSGPMDPRIAEITTESADDIGDANVDVYAVQSVYEFRMNMQAVDSVAVCEEYQYLKENGMEMVDESAADTIKSWFNRAKETIVSLGKRIAEFFKKVLHRIEARVKGDKEFVEKYQNKVNGTVSLGNNSITATDFTAINIIGNATGNYSAITQSIKNSWGTANAGANGISTTTSADAKKKVCVDIATKIIPGKGKDCDSVEKFNKAMDELIKNTKKVYTTVNTGDVLAVLRDTQKDRKAISKSFDDNKTSLNVAIMELKALQARSEKNSDDFKGAKKSVDVINGALTMMTSYNRYVTSAFEARRSLYKKLIIAAARQTAKDNNESNYDESAMLNAFNMY